MKTTHIPNICCLACGEPADAASSVDGERVPEPGDFTVCLYCGHIMVFYKQDGQLRLGNLTAEECRKVAGDKRILAIQRARLDAKMT